MKEKKKKQAKKCWCDVMTKRKYQNERIKKTLNKHPLSEENKSKIKKTRKK